MASVGVALPISTKLTVDSRFHRIYTNTYHVYAPFNSGPLTAVNATGIPAYGAAYSWGADIDLWAFASNYDATYDEKDDTNIAGVDCHKYTVTVEFTTEPTDYPSGTTRADPTAYPARIGGSFINFMVPAHRDRLGKPIVNKAYEPYDPTPEVEDSHDTLTIEYATANINLVTRAEYRNTVNSEPIWGLEKRQVKLVAWNWRVLYYGATPYVLHNFEFHINRIEHPVACGDDPAADPKVGWYTTLPNSGMKELKTLSDSTKVAVEIKDKYDQPLSVPVFLNCNGERAAVTEDTWNRFELEYEKDFNLIPGMPNPLPGPFTLV